jgi:hypothetical protein
MKHYFLLIVLAMIVIAVVGWFGWMVLRALGTLIGDWRLNRELDVLEAECAARRLERKSGPRSSTAVGESNSPHTT